MKGITGFFAALRMTESTFCGACLIVMPGREYQEELAKSVDARPCPTRGTRQCARSGNGRAARRDAARPSENSDQSLKLRESNGVCVWTVKTPRLEASTAAMAVAPALSESEEVALVVMTTLKVTV